MQRVWITGYRAYELGVFSEKEPKFLVLQYALKKLITQAIDDGTTWVITGGQMGIEQWAAQVGIDLKKDYPELQVAMMTPFTHFGSQWKPDNQAKLATLLSQVDFQASVSTHDYTSPQQLRNYQEFMLSHTDGAILVYDVDNEGKSRYDYNAIVKWQDKHDYPLQMIDFDQLQEFSYEFAENSNKGFNSN
ncbi:DUF1273 domain-containing protein [Lactobacillus sp. LC28-10]|uniref:UPF0398 protein HC026_02310 n=1 Tax=Secundilactobacillus angelensis TaxID=2722706 RepID=A0ABX1KVV6_9LACO|nr:DUF1273 domain-containing protein [Secundilactobacillus angelensis]MCH5461438.1 DUF1273 domain-containing protein [Secundilactobacillus angelensis]NLR17749.1 DUF1273 domain-containing protein [Secundilactobacillus angelensis]